MVRELNNSERVLQTFADLMIQKIEQVEGNWQQPWFNPTGYGMPQNLTGREYNGSNSFLLFLLGSVKNFPLPIYLTFKQAKDEGLLINKGAKSFPIMYWNMTVKGCVPKTQEKTLTIQDYNILSKEEQKKYKVTPYLKTYNVFNIDQTNIREQKPELFQKLSDRFEIPELKDEKGMFVNAELDRMLDKQNWLCKIYVKSSNQAFYKPLDDSITIPLKGQFKDGQSFYATLLHEMAHSTGIESRLGRNIKSAFGDPKYAKEELIAEMTSALVAQSLGISAGIREENAQYLKNWLGALREEPKFILSVLTDVNKVAAKIQKVIMQQQIKEEQEQEQKEELRIEERQNQEPLCETVNDIKDFASTAMLISSINPNSALFKFYNIYDNMPVVVNPAIKDVDIKKSNIGNGYSLYVNNIYIAEINKADINKYITNKPTTAKDGALQAVELASKYLPEQPFTQQFEFYKAVIDNNKEKLYQLKDEEYTPSENLIAALKESNCISETMDKNISFIFAVGGIKITEEKNNEAFFILKNGKEGKAAYIGYNWNIFNKDGIKDGFNPSEMRLIKSALEYHISNKTIKNPKQLELFS